jgi:hypothetical protein
MMGESTYELLVGSLDAGQLFSQNGILQLELCQIIVVLFDDVDLVLVVAGIGTSQHSGSAAMESALFGSV